MRTHGTLTKWNDDRGFGFLAPAGGGADVFVHISAFPRDGRKPEVGETVSFEVQPADGGKTRAVRVQRPGQAAPRRSGTRPSQRRETPRRARSGLGVAALLLVVVGGFGYARFASDSPVPSPLPLRQVPVVDTQAGNPRGFQCDGRRTCSQMTSCAEAEYFLANCPGTQMDGNNDGEPCEQQWCN